jgi:hypothetical protein
MGDKRDAYRVLVGKPREGRYLEDIGTDGRKILEMNLREIDWDGMD